MRTLKERKYKMIIFVTIAIAFFIVLVFSLIFGHDHDLGHDLDHGIGDTDGTISIFSTKVIATLGLGFGAIGAIARSYKCSYMTSSICGVLGGVVVAFLAYLILSYFYKQQSSSTIKLNDLIGSFGRVTVSINSMSSGEVGISYNGLYDTYLAVSNKKENIPQNTQIKVIGVAGSQLEVEKV
ncbi:MAG: NfeD family protein [Candidatus Nanoarchaeia archaeon]